MTADCFRVTRNAIWKHSDIFPP